MTPPLRLLSLHKREGLAEPYSGLTKVRRLVTSYR